jgi:predicted metal-dependent peptidase
MNTFENLMDQVINARTRMLFDLPFFGLLATRLKVVDASAWVPTAATDGKYLYLNVDFMSKLDRNEMTFVFGHEVLHCVYDHMARCQWRDPKQHNRAADYVLNLDLVASKCGRVPTSIGVLLDDKFKGLSSEEVYELLNEDKAANAKDGFDVHMDADGKFRDGNGDEITPDPTGKNGPIPMTGAERARNAAEMNNAVIQAVKAGGQEVPETVKRMVADLTEPKMDWRDVILSKIQASFTCDTSFSRYNRKSQSCGFILPGRIPDVRIDVCVAIDTSGSITDAILTYFLSEISGMMGQFSEYAIKVWCFDTKTHNLRVYDQYASEDVADYEPDGGGGTDFECNWKMMLNEGIVPNTFIMLTDGYPNGGWGDPNYCDTIFTIVGDPDGKIIAPFGTTVHLPAL